MTDALNVWMVTRKAPPRRTSAGLSGARVLRSRSKSFASSGAYTNFLTQDESDPIAFAYGATYKRLVEVKKKYDPPNFFRMNQYISPV